jgi:integrase
LLLTEEFEKFILSSASGRRLTASGKRIGAGTIDQYRQVYKLLQQFETKQQTRFRIQLLYRHSKRQLQQEKNYWQRFYRKFLQYLYKERGCYDQYAGSVCKGIKVLFRYLAIEKGLPTGEYYKTFRVPQGQLKPVVLTPAQLRWLITDEQFTSQLRPSLQRTKDLFVFGCTTGLRYADLMRLKRTDLQYLPEGGVCLSLPTGKTGAVVQIPLPDYALSITEKYKRKSGRYLLPRLANSNFNLQIKEVIRLAGWDHPLPRLRQRQGRLQEVRNREGGCWRFYEHITAHTMRRTAITTLLLLGVDENSVRQLSGHAPGSREFYRYVALVQDYLNDRVKKAQARLISGEGVLG